MVEICIGKSSRLRASGSYSRIDFAASTRKLALVALIPLFTDGEFEKSHLFNAYQGSLAHFLKDARNRAVIVKPTRVQAVLDQLCPKSTQMNLYIASGKEDQPSHYLRLSRNLENGLWEPDCDRLYAIRSDAKPPKNGIQAYWHTIYSPIPEIAVRLPLHYKRIISGGRGIYELVLELQDYTDLRAQLTHCAMISEMFGGRNNDEITVRQDRGKVRFQIDSSVSCDGGYVNPYLFKASRVNPYARKVSKPNVIIWGNAQDRSLLAVQIPRSIQPQIRGAQEYDFGTRADERDFIQSILLSRLLPFVGIRREDSTVDVFGISYAPQQQRTIVVAYSVGLRGALLAAIPTFFQLKGRPTFWPNDKAVAVLRDMLSAIDSENKSHVKRLLRAFAWLGVTKSETFVTAFQCWRRPLLEEHLLSLCSVFKS